MLEEEEGLLSSWGLVHNNFQLALLVKCLFLAFLIALIIYCLLTVTVVVVVFVSGSVSFLYIYIFFLRASRLGAKRLRQRTWPRLQFVQTETVGETVATSSPLDAAASINKSINNCESCSQCSQPAYLPLRPCLLPLLCTTLFDCPSIIHTHISINIQASRFPVVRVRSAAVRRTPARPERPLLMAPSGPFLRLSITITFCQLRRRNAKKRNGSHCPRPQQQQQTPSEATKVPPTRVAPRKPRERQWTSKRLKPYWYLLCIFVYSIYSEVLGKSEQNPFVCS